MYSHPMQHILKYTFISLILLLSSAFTYGQQKRVQGPWLGFEAGSLVRKYFEPGLDAYTFSLDYEVDLKYYPVIEMGVFDIHKDQDKLTYQSNGYFGKIGLNYNFLSNKGIWDYNMVYGGMRLGLANYEHNAEDILIENDYFGDYQIDNISATGLNALWMEVVAGLRVEVVSNIFLGWSLRGKIMMFKDKGTKMPPYFIPGYGRGENNASLRIQYYISYQIPIIHKKYDALEN